MKKVIWLSVATTGALILFWPLGIILSIVTIITWNKESKKDCALEAQINLIARQLGINYGTPEEKLAQIAKLAMNIKETGRE